MNSHGRVVIVTGICLGFSFYPLIGSTFGLFVTPIVAETGWSRGQTAVAFSLTMALVGVMAPFCGYLMDRWGARRVILLCTTMSALLLASSSLLGRSLALFYLVYLLLGVFSIGQSPIAYSWIIVRWFDRNRGLALGLAATGAGIGMMVLPLLVEPVIRRFGWRSGYFVLAGCIVLVVIPLVYRFLVDNPPRATAAPGTVDRVSVGDRTFVEAIKTRTFWLMLVSFSLMAALVQGAMLHLAPLLMDRGFTSETAAKVLSSAGFGLIVGRVVAGWALDRFEPRRVVSIFFATSMVSGALLLGSQIGFATAVLAACLIGMGIGAEGDFMAYLTSRYFGLKAFGAIYGLVGAAVPIGGFVGPVLLGFSHDTLHSYRPVLLVLLVLCGLGALCVTGYRSELLVAEDGSASAGTGTSAS